MISEMRLSKLTSQLSGAVLYGMDKKFKRCVLDSREVQEGDLFVALKGANYDAHDFIEQAHRQGAAAALVSRQCRSELAQIHVPDTLRALAQLAGINRKLFKGDVVALTGSAGKTTTKEMIASVLREQAPTYATQGNFNNEIGVPKTLLALSDEYSYAVVEMGAAKAHDIAYLMEFVEPDIGVLLNALAAHIEGFGDLDTVAQTKYEVISCLKKGARAIINLDNQYSEQWIKSSTQRSYIAYTREHDDTIVDSDKVVYATDINCAPWWSEFKLNYQQQHIVIKLNIAGEHNISNALAAAAVGIMLGFELPIIAAGLEKFKPVSGRMVRYKGINNSTIIDDTYNANPQAVKHAIDTLKEIPGNRILILGDMAELGDSALQQHRDIGDYAKGKIDCVWALGELSIAAVDAFNTQARHFTSQSTLLEYAEKNITENDVILLKGSRFMQLEKVVESLKHQHQGEF